jgi:hypothetical protein
VIPFNLGELPHFLVASILGTEHGIGVRNGCFCAHPYLTQLLGLPPTDALQLRQQMSGGDRRGMPGMVRISFGMYNNVDEIELLADALTRIASGHYRGRYQQDVHSGEFVASGWEPDLGSHFRLHPAGQRGQGEVATVVG